MTVLNKTRPFQNYESVKRRLQDWLSLMINVYALDKVTEND